MKSVEDVLGEFAPELAEKVPACPEGGLARGFGRREKSHGKEVVKDNCDGLVEQG